LVKSILQAGFTINFSKSISALLVPHINGLKTRKYMAFENHTNPPIRKTIAPRNKRRLQFASGLTSSVFNTY
jgi:hypothetical protein